MQSSPIHLHWREYEQRVSEIVAGLGKKGHELGFGIGGIVARLGKEEYELGSGRCNRLEGKSGYKHQIDISLRSYDRIELIECKCWSRTVSPSHVLTLLARVQDIQAKNPKVQVRGILISNLGFQKGAGTLADHYPTVELQIVYDNGRGYDWGPLAAILTERLGVVNPSTRNAGANLDALRLP